MGELYRDRLDRAMDRDGPDWPERCKKCLTANGCDPGRTLYCPPDIGCPDYPFTSKDNNGRTRP